MWWNDIQEIKEELVRLNVRFTELLLSLEYKVEKILGYTQYKCSTKDFNELKLETVIKDAIIEEFNSEDEFNSINRIHDKLNALVEDSNRKDSVLLAERTLDKFDDYMTNVDKLNGMINEFKGCVSMARAAIAERKEIEDAVKNSKEIYRAMVSFIKASKDIKQEAHFKIDAIYKSLCEKDEKKSGKKRKTKKDYLDT